MAMQGRLRVNCTQKLTIYVKSLKYDSIVSFFKKNC